MSNRSQTTFGRVEETHLQLYAISCVLMHVKYVDLSGPRCILLTYSMATYCDIIFDRIFLYVKNIYFCCLGFVKNSFIEYVMFYV